MKTRVEQRLRELGIELPDAPIPVGAYRTAIISGNSVYVSGQLPLLEGKLTVKGKLGDGLSVEQGAEAARIAAINSISVLKELLLDLDRVKRVLKITGYVASAEGFISQAEVINGASELYFDVFGERGRHARAAVGVNELPLGAPVEIELIAEIGY
ncbi:MAG: RidA family protein [Candidatus Dadabacteria bacterium]|nr:RidA family protein [Candidatus Dadabacteria bacterium]